MHLASLAPVWHFHGSSCGPERTGPPSGWLVTVNWAGKALVDFGDGAWYDVPASEEYLTPLAADDPSRARYDARANSAQPRPDRRS